MNASPPLPTFSLLWPEGTRGESLPLAPATWHDLGLSQLAAAFTPQPDHLREVTRLLESLCLDPAVIRYRQAVLADLQAAPALVQRLNALLPAIDALGRFSYRVVKDPTSLHEVTWRLGELQSIVECLEGLGSALAMGDGLRSQGLGRLQTEVRALQADPLYASLAAALPDLLARLRTAASVTIGVNLDQYLRPVEATLLSVNEEKFTTASVLDRLFGKAADEMQGIAPLHSVPRKEVEGPYALPVTPELGWAVEPMMVPLFKDLAEVIEKTTRPIARELKRYSEIQSRFFVNLRQDLIFYLGALRWMEPVLAGGLSLCWPELARREERVCQVEDSYNLNLALQVLARQETLRERVIPNPIQMGPEGRILILTGPNQGGKTTYLQGVGIVQVLAQVGLPVPGSRARISPVSEILTHFPIEEKPASEDGRFGDEARRLGEIFHKVQSSSLVLLNETLSSTNAGESLYLAQDLMRLLRRAGVRVLYATHLHELAAQVEALNADTPGDSRIVSLVASPVEGETVRSYRVEVRPPLGKSYAQELAARYGLEYHQLEQQLRTRGVL